MHVQTDSTDPRPLFSQMKRCKDVASCYSWFFLLLCLTNKWVTSTVGTRIGPVRRDSPSIFPPPVFVPVVHRSHCLLPLSLRLRRAWGKSLSLVHSLKFSPSFSCIPVMSESATHMHAHMHTQKKFSKIFRTEKVCFSNRAELLSVDSGL